MDHDFKRAENAARRRAEHAEAKEKYEWVAEHYNGPWEMFIDPVALHDDLNELARLKRVNAELVKALIAAQTRLLPELPEGWTINKLECFPGLRDWSVSLQKLLDPTTGVNEYGEGPTPRAACLTAIAKIPKVP